MIAQDVAIIAALMLSMGATVMGMGVFIFGYWNKRNPR